MPIGFLGISISPEAIYQNVQVAGKHLKKWDAKTSLDHTGKRVVHLLIIETDGAAVNINTASGLDPGRVFQLLYLPAHDKIKLG